MAPKPRPRRRRSSLRDAAEAAMRNRVLNEVLDAFGELDKSAGIEGVFQVIQRLKKKQQAMAEDNS
jgi:hypothetical protein